MGRTMLQGTPRQYFGIFAVFVVGSLFYLNSSIPRSEGLEVFGGLAGDNHTKSFLSKPPIDTKDPLHDAIAALFQTIKVPPSQDYYRDSKGKHFAGGPSDDMPWQEPLGKKLLIVDIDTRVPTGEKQLMDPDHKVDWEALESGGSGLVSHAIANHYLYALIHGYEYRYYQARDMPDHYPTWIRPHIFKQLLPDYQFIVAMDADVVVSHLDVPLEWMFNRWGIAKNTSMALPHDTEEFRDGKSISTDSRGEPVLNGGFVISQNNERTFEMLEAWGNCTTEVRYPGCAKWKHEWSHEQRAFSEYIRYDFGKIPRSIVGIPCDDAMGYPNFKSENDRDDNKVSDCNGNFIRHYTLSKGKVHSGGAETMAQALAEVLQKNLLSNQDMLVIKETDPAQVAWEGPAAWEAMHTNADDDDDRDFE